MAPQFFNPNKSEISPDYKEVARYLGYTKENSPTQEVANLIKNCAEEMGKILTPKATYEEFEILNSKLMDSINQITFADVDFVSKDLSKNLNGCSKVVLIAATIGSQVDMLIRKTEHFDSVKAAIFQATGAMYIEKVVDLLNEKISAESKAQGYSTRPRFSPGYGDVNLDIQKDFFRLLPCSKIGLTLMDTLIMAPEKSVTAFIGKKRG